MKIKKKTYRKTINIFVYTSILILVFILGFNTNRNLSTKTNMASPFVYSFNVDGVLNETGEMDESSSPYWWLNSGGTMKIKEGSGSTNIGEMSKLSKWRILYKISNSKDTDDGYHPQNIFRLVTRNKWQNFSSQGYFNILKDNLSSSSNRNASNGVLLMLRYQDGDNLYYAGIRVDGTAVIKKKINGEYTTLAQQKIFGGGYGRETNPNLLPKNKWLGLRSEVTNENNSVRIKLFGDLNQTGEWQKIIEVVDSKKLSGTEPIYNEGFQGIRTDFMDVEFKDFRVEKI